MRGNPGPSHFLSGCGASFANLRDQLFRHRFKKLFRPAIFYFRLRNVTSLKRKRGVKISGGSYLVFSYFSLRNEKGVVPVTERKIFVR